MRKLIWAAILLALTAQADDTRPCRADEAVAVQVGAQAFQVEVAASYAQRVQGLSGHAPLAPGQGMWFVMPEPEWPGFWMQGMTFGLDLVWVGTDRHVLAAETLPACHDHSDCQVHYPPAPAAYVLEVKAGEFHGQRGDLVSWSCQPHQL